MRRMMDSPWTVVGVLLAMTICFVGYVHAQAPASAPLATTLQDPAPTQTPEAPPAPVLSETHQLTIQLLESRLREVQARIDAAQAKIQAAQQEAAMLNQQAGELFRSLQRPGFKIERNAETGQYHYVAVPETPTTPTPEPAKGGGRGGQ